MMKTWILFLLAAGLSRPCAAVIGGESGQVFPEVVRLEAGKKVCTGTIIGPRTILSAAHCVTTQGTHFMYKGKKYDVKYVTSDRQDQGHDLALAITEKKIEGAIFARLGQGLKHGAQLLMAGFGCTVKGGKPGALHVGKTRVIGMDKDHVLAASPQGSVLCEGDSGGPAFATDGMKRWLVAVSSLSDLRKININVRIDSALSHAFLKTAARLNRLEICGITAAC